MDELIDINYYVGKCDFDDIGLVDVYYFYPLGVWDEDKRLLKDAERKYPKDKYNWILFDA